MGERSAIHVFQLAADRYTVRDAARTYPSPQRDLAEEVRGRFALDGRIRREDQLRDRLLCQNRLELADAELLRTDAVERRKMPVEDEVLAAVAPRVLDGHHVGRRLHHAEQ